MAPNGHSRLFGVRLWLGTASLKRLMKGTECDRTASRGDVVEREPDNRCA